MPPPGISVRELRGAGHLAQSHQDADFHTESRSLGYVLTNQFMPKRYKHLFEQVVSLENLFAAARKAMRGKRGKLPATAGRAILWRI